MRSRLASAGLAPRVETAIEIGPTRAMAGMMKLQSGGTSTTLTSIVRASASWKTRTLSSVSAVAAKTEERALEVGAAVLAQVEPQRALARELLDLGQRVQRDHVHVGLGGQQALDLLEADRARRRPRGSAARAGSGTS